MKAWGIGILCLGIAVLIGSLFMPTSVPVERMTALSSLDIKIGSGVYDQVFNLQRAYNRSLVFESGWFLILGGLVLIAGGAVLERIAAIGGGDTNDEAEPSRTVGDDDIAARAAAKASAAMATTISAHGADPHYDADRFMIRFVIGGFVAIAVIMLVIMIVNGTSR